MSLDRVLTRTSGTPAHTPEPGTLAVDAATGVLYVRTSGGARAWLGAP